jgi:hypothetical protein
MFKRIHGFLAHFIETWIAPYYHVGAAIALIIALLNWVLGKLRPFILVQFERIYEWWTGVDIAPITRVPDPFKYLVLFTFNALLVALLIAIFQIFRSRRRWRFVVGEIRNSIELHLEFRQRIAKMKASNSRIERARVSTEARGHVIELCGRITQIFEHLLHEQCHTTVKSFSPETGGVSTRARDAMTHNAERVQADEGINSYSYEDNTAFQRILDDENCYMFLSNYLWLRATCGSYKNSNESWMNFYRAAIVLPITRMRNKKKINKDTVIGFLCVDSFRGRFWSRNSRTILLVFVVMIHDVMLLLGSPATVVNGENHG